MRFNHERNGIRDPMGCKPNEIKETTTRRDIDILVNTMDYGCVRDEVHAICMDAYPSFDFKRVDMVFNDVVRLFRGQYPGYRGCNTEYHDLKHTTDVLLALASLLNGYRLTGNGVSQPMFELALIAALMHDTGYIQQSVDCSGTGAKYTSVHVERSLIFITEYFEQQGWSLKEMAACCRMVAATELSFSFDDIPFITSEESRAGRALFCADLLGQMADRVYLEKLLFLYMEFSEAHVQGYASEKELLMKTTGFYDLMWKRLHDGAGYESASMRAHFNHRHKLDEDLYCISARRNMEYLQEVLQSESDHRRMLQRGGIVERLKRMESYGLQQ